MGVTVLDAGSRLNAVKDVASHREPNGDVRPLLESFRMMVYHAIWVGQRHNIRGRFKLIRAVYKELKRYGLHTHYALSARKAASAILKNHKRNHRSVAPSVDANMRTAGFTVDSTSAQRQDAP